MSQVHPQARITPRTRTEIRCSTESAGKLAELYNISKASALKRRGLDDCLDRAPRAHDLGTTLSPAQERLVLEMCRLCLLPLDDLLSLTQRFINPKASRAGVSRLLRREGTASARLTFSALARVCRRLA